MALGAVAALAVGAIPAQANEAVTYRSEMYVIRDPALAQNPDIVRVTLERDGNLDALGIQPSAAAGQAPSAAKPRIAAADPPYAVDSSRFPAGRKPADPYDYMNHANCLANAATAGQDAGWIKNRFSYCQIDLVWAVDLKCGPRGCQVIGAIGATSAVVGYGKIGSHPENATQRFADFRLVTTIVYTKGVFDQPNATMQATVRCAGEYRVGFGIPNDRACHPGKFETRKATIPQWRLDPNSYFDLLSDGYQPGAEFGEQLAQGVFKFEYEFTPKRDVDLKSVSPEGGLRFDSAFYLRDKQGSIFDRAVPGMAYRKSDAGVAGHAVHIDEARANPDATVPTKQGKRLLGGSSAPGDSLHRLTSARSEDSRARAERNRTVSTNFCKTVKMPPKPPEGGPFDCDEYAFASSYEGSARNEYDGAQYALDYTVRWVNSDQNQEAGRRLFGWQENDRILDLGRDQKLDPHDQERFYIPINP
ncbi:NucA/NucB deoxyribonuclease domain-containing protein [Amycolatopsis alba]|uniref:Deoxyribonuclease NucA/NucB domain-containing protein n=1 Tax=Amycolatopsis alba DSM 44262 TaxID=1125972 RepID=A0A229RAD5_AMYAL|nr:hypothetical protein [Amycolatopsis alba]OXM43411.1 hypothetical protein CFP75_38595 [Amycolatopsis alba DSM 44262]